jgi:SHS2 domain-containing protein
MDKYKFLDHTADALFEAYGKDLNELFTSAALAVEEIQVTTKDVEAKEERTIELENEKIDILLFDFLQELIYYKDADQLLFSKFDVKITKNSIYKLRATCSGEKINTKKHTFHVDAKAITLHQFEVKKEKDHWKARVIVDI